MPSSRASLDGKALARQIRPGWACCEGTARALSAGRAAIDCLRAQSHSSLSRTICSDIRNRRSCSSD
jgi:hypothetical protein